MQEEYGIQPNLNHYGYMVDLHGRSRDLDSCGALIFGFTFINMEFKQLWCLELGIMQEEFGIEPNLKHYGYIVDLLGRARHLDSYCSTWWVLTDCIYNESYHISS